MFSLKTSVLAIGITLASTTAFATPQTLGTLADASLDLNQGAGYYIWNHKIRPRIEAFAGARMTVQQPMWSIGTAC
jgi:hypothetical protein